MRIELPHSGQAISSCVLAGTGNELWQWGQRGSALMLSLKSAALASAPLLSVEVSVRIHVERGLAGRSAMSRLPHLFARPRNFHRIRKPAASRSSGRLRINRGRTLNTSRLFPRPSRRYRSIPEHRRILSPIIEVIVTCRQELSQNLICSR
jgi:hypothetical protein